jgi:hypothetical protein
MVRITNRFLQSSRDFVWEQFGSGEWDRMLAARSPETRAAYDVRLDPKGSVAFPVVLDVLAGVAGKEDAQHPDVLYSLGFFNSEKDLSGTQKLVMRLLSPEWVLKMAAILWGQRVQNGGTFGVEVLSRGHVRATIRSFPSPDDLWWRYLRGWFTCAIHFSGGRDVDVRWVGGGKAPTDPAVYEAKWR